MTDRTPESPGWYEDPDGPGQLRYFDGILWTSHVTPLRTRTPAPAPYAPGGAASGPTTSGATATGAEPFTPTAGPTTPAAPRAPLPPPAANPYAASNPYGAPPPVGLTHTGPTAPDGTPLASLGLRVVAYLLDSVIINVLALIGGGWFMYRAIAPVLPAMTKAIEQNDADAFNAAFALIDFTYVALYTAVKLLIALAYGVLSLTRWSATPSMLAVGISVRRTGRPGVIGWDAASKRVGFVVVIDALTNLPTLGIVALLVKVLNIVRPFRDPMRQAWHDKVADTLVVAGRQPKRATHG